LGWWKREGQNRRGVQALGVAKKGEGGNGEQIGGPAVWAGQPTQRKTCEGEKGRGRLNPPPACPPLAPAGGEAFVAKEAERAERRSGRFRVGLGAQGRTGSGGSGTATGPSSGGGGGGSSSSGRGDGAGSAGANSSAGSSSSGSYVLESQSWVERFGEEPLKHPYAYMLFLGQDARGDYLPCK